MVTDLRNGFVVRVCRTTLIFGLLLFLLLCEFQDWRLLVNYGVGLLIGMLFVYTTGMLVTESIFGSGLKRRSWLVVSLMVAKYALLILALYVLLRYDAMNPAGLLIGLSLTPAVLVLKFVGQCIKGNQNASAHADMGCISSAEQRSDADKV